MRGAELVEGMLWFDCLPMGTERRQWNYSRQNHCRQLLRRLECGTRDYLSPLHVSLPRPALIHRTSDLSAVFGANGTANASRTQATNITKNTAQHRHAAHLSAACTSPRAAVHMRLQTLFLCVSPCLFRNYGSWLKANAVSHCLRHAGLVALCNHRL